MRKKKEKKLLPALMTLTVCGGFVLLLAGYGIHYLTEHEIITVPTEQEKLGVVSSSTRVDIDWEALYPHETEEEAGADTASSEDAETGTATAGDTEENAIRTVSDLPVISTISEKLTYLSSTLSGIEEYTVAYDAMRTIGGKAKSLWASGVPYTSATEVETDDGYFLRLSEERTEESYRESVENISDFQAYLAEKDIPMLYVQTPTKESREDDANYMAGGQVSYTNANMDLYVSMLREAGVDTLDLRDETENWGDSYHSRFFKTDHHWKYATGLWATQQMVQYLNETYDCEFDENSIREDAFEELVYEDAMFGSDGMTVGRGTAEKEDFVFPNATEDTAFHVVYPTLDLDLTGTMQETMVNEDYINSMVDVGYYAYSAVLHGIIPLINIENLNRTDGKKILFIRDSYGEAVAPYLSMVAGSVDVLDIRPTNGNFYGSVHAYVEATQPDLVILLYSTPMTLDYE